MMSDKAFTVKLRNSDITHVSSLVGALDQMAADESESMENVAVLNTSEYVKIITPDATIYVDKDKTVTIYLHKKS